jgi:septal ring factor EnvC (AmiA/AmiB activator)
MNIPIPRRVYPSQMELAQRRATDLELAQQAATRRELAAQLAIQIELAKRAERAKRAKRAKEAEEECEDESSCTCEDYEHFTSMNTQKAKPTNTFYTMLSRYFKS